MGDIFYFNINYFCNNDCRFCFSSSTGDNTNLVAKEIIIEKARELSETDTIVLNGGEPTIHPHFYDIIKNLIEISKSRIVVYTNGRNIDVSKIDNNDRLRFVIPIHGGEMIHDHMTQREGSYSDTLSTIRKLNESGFCVNLKFIVSQDYLKSDFSIKQFLEKESISSNLIIIARLNNTKKSVRNGVEPVNLTLYRKYISEVYMELKDSHSLMFLDTPLCYLPGFDIKTIPIPPDFFFSDYKNENVQRKYYKEICIEEKCDACIKKSICKLLSSSYLTVYYDKKWLIKSE